jgi:hypothetical protein
LFRCANVICHEVAHQWFGNLVTAASWPDLLVNEGLATLAEYGCMAAVLPTQVGPQGAAVLIRGMFGGPAGVNSGVHEGEELGSADLDERPLLHCSWQYTCASSISTLSQIPVKYKYVNLNRYSGLVTATSSNPDTYFA